MIKLFQYRSSGVKEYWIVDKEKDHILLYNFKNNSIEEYSFMDSVKVGLYDNFTIDFSKLDLQ